MKFMVTWNIPDGNWLPVMKTFSSMSPAERANYGDYVYYLTPPLRIQYRIIGC